MHESTAYMRMAEVYKALELMLLRTGSGGGLHQPRVEEVRAVAGRIVLLRKRAAVGDLLPWRWT